MSARTLVFVGCLTRPTPYFAGAHAEEGLAIFALDEDTGRLRILGRTGGIDNPTFLSVSPHGYLYATSEVFGWNEGVVSAYAIDPANGTLGYINKQPTLGSISAHNSLDRTGRYLFVTNYGHDYPGEVPDRSVAVYPIRDDGGLGAPLCSVKHAGTGPVPGRQVRPHPHSALASPDNRFVLVADLGIDQLVTYRCESGLLSQVAGVRTVLPPPGSGPRHFVFSADGRTVYLLCEIASTIAHLRYEPESGGLSLLGTYAALPGGAGRESLGADLHLSPDGRFLYGSSRGHDSLVIYRVRDDNGELSLVGYQPTGGRTPRNFAITPSGRFLLVANQDSDEVVVFRRDEANGGLQHCSSVEVGTPMCIKICGA